MKNDLVSILIPTYNRRGIVDDAIDCSIKQTYSNIEVIVSDNCSDDGSYDYLISKYEKDPRVKIYKNSTNVGPVNNWIECLKYSQGEFIKILWSDDMMDYDFVEKAVRVLSDNERISFVYSKVVQSFLGEKRQYGRIIYDIGDEGTYDRVFFNNEECLGKGRVPVSPGCALFRKRDVEILTAVPNKLTLDHTINGAGIDLLIYLNALKRYDFFYYLKSSNNYFRIHPKSFSCMGNDLYPYYFTAKVYYYKEVARDNTYLKLLVENYIKYGIRNGMDAYEIWRYIKGIGVYISAFIFLKKYLKICKEILFY